jgi:peptide methionine sulfoxide reductase msrA/msrB
MLKTTKHISPLILICSLYTWGAQNLSAQALSAQALSAQALSAQNPTVPTPVAPLKEGPSPASTLVKKHKKTELNTAKAYFAGGCFWCTEADFEKTDGVITAISGYMGGTIINPSYAQVSAGRTKHVESIKVTYDPKKVSYSALVDKFWRTINPTDSGGQFVDRGAQYRPVIFVSDDAQRKIAIESKDKLNRSGVFKKNISVEIINATVFYPAEDYHQNYYKKNPVRYRYYRFNSGRDQFLKKTWPSK